MWAVRRNVAEAFKVYSPIQSLEDIVVPFAQIPDLIPELERISAEFGITIPCYGHAGDGNLHATLVSRPGTTEGEWREVEARALADLYREVARLGGTISGEHGIGSKRRDFMRLVMDETQISLQRQIKDVFDPNHVLNPGKMFPEPVNAT